MNVLERIKGILDKCLEWINIILLAVMTVLVTYQVIARYFFNAANAIAETLAQYMFVWTIMFGSAYVFGKREHLEISVLKDHLKPLPRFIVDCLINITLFVFALTVMVIGGYAQTSKQMIQLDAALQIPMGYIYMAVPICGVAMMFYAVYLCADDYRKYKQKIQKGDKS